MVYCDPMATDEMTHRACGYSAGLAAAAVLSTTAIFIRYLTQRYGMPPLALAFWRDVFVVLTLGIVFAARRYSQLRISWRQLPFLIAYGLVLAAFNAMWTLSVAHNGAAVATVLAYCSAAFTALLGWVLFKERPTGMMFAAIVISLTGCALVAGALTPSAWQTNLLGIATGILAGLTYAGYSVMGHAASRRGLGPWTSLFYTFAFAAVLLLAVQAPSAPGELLWLGTQVEGWGVLFLLAAGPTVAGFGLYNVTLAYLSPSVANLLVTLEPACTAVIAYVFLGEKLTIMQVLGSLLILCAVVLLRVSERRRCLMDQPRLLRYQDVPQGSVEQ